MARSKRALGQGKLVEPSVANAAPGAMFQFERLGF